MLGKHWDERRKGSPKKSRSQFGNGTEWDRVSHMMHRDMICSLHLL